MSTLNADKKRSWLMYIVDRNPCYLLSGLCMLFGCHLLCAAMLTPAGDVRKLLTLLAVANVYEVLLVILGLVLIRRNGFERDGRMLLTLESLFLADITFLNGVICTVDVRWGMLINAILLALAVLKVGIILRALRLQAAGRMILFFSLQTLVLLVVPTVFKLIAAPRNGRMPQWVVYAGWWVAGMLPAIGMMLHRTRKPQWTPMPGREVGMGRLFMVLPFMSLLVHLYSAGWVYSVAFEWAYVSPIVLGMAIGMPVCENWMIRRQAIVNAQLFLIGLAVFLSLDAPNSMHWQAPVFGNLILAPLRLTLIGAAGTVLFVLWYSGQFGLIWMAAASVLLAILGHTLTAILTTLVKLIVALAGLVWHAMPRTMLQWGMASVGSAFVLLGLGAMMSYHKAARLRRPPELPESQAGG